MDLKSAHLLVCLSRTVKSEGCTFQVVKRSTYLEFLSLYASLNCNNSKFGNILPVVCYFCYSIFQFDDFFQDLYDFSVCSFSTENKVYDEDLKR